eukprot:SAG11_NODE_16100_length_557_cov_0.565502_1_plen_137_part_10
MEAGAARDVYASLFETASSLGRPLLNAGYKATSSLSLEKGYRHWHADLRPTDNPFMCAPHQSLRYPWWHYYADLICRTTDCCMFVAGPTLASHASSTRTRRSLAARRWKHGVPVPTADLRHASAASPLTATSRCEPH